MSDYEMLNQRVAAKKAARRKDALRRLAYMLTIILAAVVLLWVLAYIGFISKLFLVILISITVCTGAFNAGRIWNGFKR